MRYCTRSVRWPTPEPSSRAIGEVPRVRLSSRSLEATVGGSCFVSPTMTSCDALAADRAQRRAGSVACEPSSKTTSGNDMFDSRSWCAPTQLDTTTCALCRMISPTASRAARSSVAAAARSPGGKEALCDRVRSSIVSGWRSARATTVRERTEGETAAGRPARTAGTPSRSSASKSTSAAPLL